ncbi:hypothetical protein KP79_PYT16008 [Mizuhopecten yessoensis]|uniref:Uncharacterized protein n=1 Tax=Mizuhopecten yessoensis TaxID=6573 RepID=A0A210PWW4_MIZYE|nr:hypothetical protein KP79_PYT16008 [Mizuhopecten yessoensis]
MTNFDENPEECEASSSLSEIGEYEEFIVEKDPLSTECHHCFSQPCVTGETYRQLWWETENKQQHARNHHCRKEVYKKFWVMLSHRQVWKYARYLQRKKQALEKYSHTRKLVWHKRDIMPNCVIQLVRRWYPNPDGVPYMGHLWN